MKRKLLPLFLSLLLLLSACSVKGDANPDTAETVGGGSIGTDSVHTCSLTVSCAVLLENGDLLDVDKAELVPEDGILLKLENAEFEPGESVMDVLRREARNAKLHLETSDTPGMGSYVEGIGNLYEFDAGELSGWLYRVNGEFQGMAASEYRLSDGDTVEYLYTCDMGADVGDTVMQ